MKRYCMVFLVAGIVPVPLVGHTDPLDDARSCALVENADLRLACYDAVFLPLPNAVAAPEPDEADASQSVEMPGPLPQSVEMPKPAPHTRGIENFGAEDLVEPEENDVREMNARVVGLRSLRSQARVIELDNGQVWREKRFKRSLRLKEGDSVRIKAGSFGLHKLYGGGKVSTDVERIE